jgi:CRP-like cAMP-binding protein
VRKIESWLLQELLGKCEDESYATVVAYESGEVIFAAGDPGDYLAILLSGQANICSGGRVLTTIEYGAVFGEMGLIDGQPRSADAVAKSFCRVAKIRESQFISMLEKTPYFALSMMRILTDRLRTATST